MADGVERGVVFGTREGMHVRWRGGRVFVLFIGDDEKKVMEHDEDVPDRDEAHRIAHEFMRKEQSWLFRH